MERARIKQPCYEISSPGHYPHTVFCTEENVAYYVEQYIEAFGVPIEEVETRRAHKDPLDFSS